MNGYILESRQILDSEIWNKPPLYFKVWHYLLMKAQYQDSGNLKRGQLFTSIDEIAEKCAYKAGYRKKKPSRKEIWSILEFLRKPHEGNNGGNTKGTMAETTKVTHGILVTICNYDKYQTPSNYEGNNEGNNERDTKETTKGTEGEQYYKEYKELKNKENNSRERLERDRPEISDIELRKKLIAGWKDHVAPEALSDMHRLWIESLEGGKQ